MDEFNTKRISIFLLFLVSGFFLISSNVLGLCGDFGSVSTSAQDYCQYLGPSSGYTDCEGSGERAYFSSSGDLVNYRCYDMCRPFGVCSCDGIFACSGCTSRSGTYQDCLAICGPDCDSECVDAKDCSTSNSGIEGSGHLAGCVYLNGRSCTTSDGSSGVCSNGVCIVNRYLAPRYSQIRIWQGTSTSISHSIRDWTSVSCSSGNNPYTCSYYIGTSSDPAFCQYEGNYYFQWRFQSVSGTWYYTDSSGNYGIRTSSSPSGIFMYNINYDADSNDCECKVGTGRYNIGGEISGCCGDDGSEYVCGGEGDSTLDYYYQDPDSDDKACCSSSTDCVYNNVCYPSNSQGPGVDQDSDPDWCGYPGTWRDCNTDAQCGGGAIFGEYEVCRSNDCKVACYNQPCVAGYSECVDEILGETLYCVNTISSESKSSYVENPAGGNTNERYCRQDEYYEPGVGCQQKKGESFEYNYLDPSVCGTGNLASVIDCDLIGKYVSFDTGKYEGVELIEPTTDPLGIVSTGRNNPVDTSNVGCIDTDGGDNPREWGCAYIMNATSNQNDSQVIGGNIGCDYNSSYNKLIEFYCSGGEILSREYTCTILGTDSYTSYCFESPSNLKDIEDPPVVKTPGKDCVPNCEGKECGADGCGGLCEPGCGPGEECSWGQCVTSCVPDCTGNVCGDDGCGGSCGICASGQECLDGQCVSSCTPNCTGKVCGPDGCGGTCGSCASGQICYEGQCCVPSCGNVECGYTNDGCGRTIYCGECASGQECSDGQCVTSCTPNCTGKECGPDGCGSTCGICASGETCYEGQCCVPNCYGRECGSDGCGGSCGSCPLGQTCDDEWGSCF